MDTLKVPITIDLFSDTNTNPCEGMRHAMATAAVGNEVAGEDPTVNKLLERVCDLLGKEQAVFLPSGTMCNGIAYRVLCQKPGDQILLDVTAHPLHKSGGLIGGLVPATPCLVTGERGIFSRKHIEPLFKKPGRNEPCIRVVSLEQTTNFGGGAIWPLETLEDVCAIAHERGALTHLDGARLLHAVVETSIPAAVYAQPFDSVWIDFSKGLGAPLGAVLAGSRDFIEEAWYYKFQQGGGLHQAGILAAACLYGLDHHLEKLSTLHLHAKTLGALLETIPFLTLPAAIETNILCFTIVHPTQTAFDLERFLRAQGIRVLALNAKTIRVMTHLDITEQAIQTVYQAIQAFGEACG